MKKLRHWLFAWKVRQQFLEANFYVFSHGQPLQVGLVLTWIQALHQGLGTSLSSKEKLQTPLRGPATVTDATSVADFHEKFPQQREGTLDRNPIIAQQLLSVSTEFFNRAGGESAVGYWRGPSYKEIKEMLRESLDALDLSPLLKNHLVSLIKAKIQVEQAAQRVGHFALIAIPKDLFPAVGYLSEPYGFSRPFSAQEMEEASVPIPKVQERDRAQARLIAHALHSYPQIESWRYSPLPKAKKMDFQKEMAWIAAYAIWATHHPEPPLLQPEEIPARLSQDKAFLQSYLAINPRFAKHLLGGVVT